ncbi:hypothetical protein BC936DRAFT_139000 [Jimgerdemannia flammicorona]|uniref:Uncharacterized protein n=2 Tax=Jimgerdemannia flammicorona TaxID=994334 RepID=A0A433Q6K8_9FUNG|nr:hypothetical protein BC936DRAFT_139000 [Jimgerdemannia flammicorona]RUS25407.1 hypothetical protein BC938DRAFT_472223 [Jimgerdemannia flammicorona]
MTPTSSTLFLLTWSAACHALALYIFMNGFLLTRQALDIRSLPLSNPWQDFPISNQTRLQVDTVPPNASSLPSVFNTLLQASSFSRLSITYPTSHPRPFQKLILVLIDALRFDFLLTYPFSAATPLPPYQNNLPLVHQLRQQHPTRSLLYQYRADPPTTTTQRLKAILTGSLPTFIDAGSSFATSAVGEDHLLRHARDKWERIYFFGDDTWTHLFPDVLSDENRTFPYESFKLFDLHTVDSGVQSHLFPLLFNSTTTSSSWDVIIAHFLGVDHCGHKYGPSHPTMREKLLEMNGVLERIVGFVDEETLLVVMGDHGMTTEGDHGGESEEELMSGLWLYSERELTLGGFGGDDGDDGRWYWRDLHTRIHSSRARTLHYDHAAITSRLAYDAASPLYPIVSQIQLVPTLSYLLGLPIPFGNLGAVIPDVVFARPPPADSPAAGSRLANLFHLIETARINALQVHTYLLKYAAAGERSHGFSRAQLEPMFESLYEAEREVEQLADTRAFEAWVGGAKLDQGQNEEMGETLEKIFFLYDAFLLRTLKHCQYHWAQFDVGCMMSGVALLALSVAVGVSLFYEGNTKGHTEWVLKRARDGAVVGLVVGLAVASAAARTVMVEGWFEKMGTIGWVGMGVTGGSLVGVLMGWVREWAHAVMRKVRDGIEAPMSWAFAGRGPLHITLITLLSHALTLASNSYILFEDRVVRFVIASVAIYLAILAAARAGDARTILRDAFAPALVFLLYTRLTALTGVCREEQYPYCSYITNSQLRLWDSDGWTVVLWAWFVMVVMLGAASVLPWYLKRKIVGAAVKGGKTTNDRFFDAYTIMLHLLVARWIWIIWLNSVTPQSAVEAGAEEEYHAIDSETLRGGGADVAGDEADLAETWGFMMANELFEVYVPLVVYIGGIALAVLGAWQGSAWDVAEVQEAEVAKEDVVVVGGCENEANNEGKVQESKEQGVEYTRCEAGVIVLSRLRPLFWIILVSISLLLATVQRPLGGLLIVTFPVILSQIIRLSAASSSSRQNHQTLSTRLILLHFFGHHLFFTTGHQATVPAIHWEAAFIGFHEMHYYTGMCLVVAATLAGWMISWAGWAIVVVEEERRKAWPEPEMALVHNGGVSEVVTGMEKEIGEVKQHKVQDAHPLQTLIASTYLLILAHALPAFFGALFITILRRHLMTWKIFAPRFLLQCMLLVGVDVAVVAIWCAVGVVGARWGRDKDRVKTR